MLFAMGSGLLLGLVSQLGDWLASGIKRWCRVRILAVFCQDMVESSTVSTARFYLAGFSGSGRLVPASDSRMTG